jgi:hypothetical protein
MDNWFTVQLRASSNVERPTPAKENHHVREIIIADPAGIS